MTQPGKPGAASAGTPTPTTLPSAAAAPAERPDRATTAEQQRLDATYAGGADWLRWGPYVSERAWGTVREDYSATGDAWDFFPHEHARSRTYRWNEDGLAGVCDRMQYLCMGLALWNEKDAILKERLFGLSGPQGNHGEDVKEYYFYLDSTPTHSYMKFLYKYPQVAFPYQQLVEENRRRGYDALEFELFDALREPLLAGRYFDVLVEYAKSSPEDILCRITITNRGPDLAPIHILPHLWYRNTWAWETDATRPNLIGMGENQVRVEHPELGARWWYVQSSTSAPLLLFTDNETNRERLFGVPNQVPYVKDSINDAVIHRHLRKCNPLQRGTKVAAHCVASLSPGEQCVVTVRLSDQTLRTPFVESEQIFAQRHAEANAFYAAVQRPTLSADEQLVQRQAFAGLLWTKQFYHFDVERWLTGDPTQPPPPTERRRGRNREWLHLNNADIISMPDKWEYPWYAAWDLAFHCIPLALVDVEFAKQQLLMLGYEWYQHPNGQVPAYEWNFSDVNPPVIAWAAWRVYQIDAQQHGKRDLPFLERVFHKLLLNFTWWVNRKDPEGDNVFGGGFLGLDNIGVFDRSSPLPTGGKIEQSDGTSWMGMFALHMLQISVELACENPVYEDIATKFFEHFLYIARAMDHMGGEHRLWDDQDGFFYDVLRLENGEHIPLKVRSMVGLIPLFAVATLESNQVTKLPGFQQRMEWFLANRPQLARLVSCGTVPGSGETRLLALVQGNRLRQILQRMLDASEFLSDYGVRALSRYHQDHPYTFVAGGARYEVKYQPAESDSGLFGGNSNWRGPIWMPVNYLLIEALREFHHYYGDDFQVEYPTGSGTMRSLGAVANELGRRLAKIFVRDEANGGQRAVFGGNTYFQQDPHWRDCVPFHEYFHGDNGAGVGASHQTGWTALVATLMQQCGELEPVQASAPESKGSSEPTAS